MAHGVEQAERLDGAAVRRILARTHAALVADRATLDALNVFPVADGDTGTNLVGSVGPVAAAAAVASDADLGTAIERSALRAGRGNSGLILSQWVTGWIRPWTGCGLDPVEAVASAARLARSSVARPVEGTMLSVADGAAGHPDPTSMRQGALDALLSTPEQLPVLADHGVVDAGGRGLLHLLDAIAVEAGAAPLRDLPGRTTADPTPAGFPLVAHVTGYEVRGRIGVVGAGMADVMRVQTDLIELGTDVVVAAEGDEVAFHAHGDPGALVRCVLAHGELRSLEIEALVEAASTESDA